LDTNAEEPDGIRRYRGFRKCPEMLTPWYEKRPVSTRGLGLQNRGLGVRVPPLLPAHPSEIVVVSSWRQFGPACFCYRFATISLPIGLEQPRGSNLTKGLSGPFLRRLQRRIELRGRILLHAGQDVAVEVERRPHSRMPQPFAGNLGMDAQ
jgi:hypothetical protein